MIKRDGVQIMNARTNNVSIAKETVFLLKQKHYVSVNKVYVNIAEDLDAAVKGTVYYKAQVPFHEYKKSASCTIEIVNETTTQAAARLIASGINNVVALNFASGHTPGGGFLGGAVAQEEDLCRCSGLYNCLRSKPEFYNDNILQDDSFYTDGVIYSPNVPFFRNDKLEFLDEPFLLSIITAPAPCVRSIENIDEDYLYDILYCRIQKILQVAELHRHKNIILGAWGCGAFGNDAAMMASVFSQVLFKEVPCFNNVIFAVYDKHDPPDTFNTFKVILGDPNVEV